MPEQVLVVLEEVSEGEKLWIKAVGIDGVASNPVTVGSDPTNYLGLSDLITARPAYETSGIDSSLDPTLVELVYGGFELMLPQFSCCRTKKKSPLSIAKSR